MTDFNLVFSIVVTIIITLAVIHLVMKPFFSSNSESLEQNQSDFKDIENEENREIFLDSLEDLELSKKGGLITDQEYLEIREILIKDMSKS